MKDNESASMAERLDGFICRPYPNTASGVGGGQTVPNSSSVIAAGSSVGTGNAGPSGVPHSTDTTSSAGFGESQVVAVQRRRSVVPQASTASSEKRRRRRRRSRPSREG
uniref:Uncharacterized protein n=1 Tax=Anopheles culicifacies TaxID=139723 RepID=A0A182M768_9DIPT